MLEKEGVDAVILKTKENNFSLKGLRHLVNLVMCTVGVLCFKFWRYFEIIKEILFLTHWTDFFPNIILFCFNTQLIPRLS